MPLSCAEHILRDSQSSSDSSQKLVNLSAVCFIFCLLFSLGYFFKSSLYINIDSLYIFLKYSKVLGDRQY